jgi:hypothetical protein
VDENWILTKDHAADEPEQIRRRMQIRELFDLSFVYTPKIAVSIRNPDRVAKWRHRRDALMTHVHQKQRRGQLLWLQPVGGVKRKYDVNVTREMLAEYATTSSAGE